MGPYGAHMGPYTRKIPKNPRKFLGIPRDLCGEPMWRTYVEDPCGGPLWRIPALDPTVDEQNPAPPLILVFWKCLVDDKNINANPCARYLCKYTGNL